jgi:K+ transporter
MRRRDASRRAAYTWIDGKEARNVSADIVHEDNSALARVARKTTPAAALAVLGIVYGDLGTSPLYTLQAVVVVRGHCRARRVAGISRYPAVIAAVDPRYGFALLMGHGWSGIAVLGGVFLAMTGAEAMYADMGHIGRNPIRASWYGIVLPALLLNYAGQVALFLDDPAMDGNPFFRLAPSWSIYPLVGLATIATIIASQAIITGSFSLTRQAMQLGWFPGVRIRQTSSEEYGQIYVPFMNWTMMVLTIALTVSFGRSDRLAGAYGTAVSTTMLLTTALLYNVMRERWRWPAGPALTASGLFLAVDFAFFTANLFKIRGRRLDSAHVRHAGVHRHGLMALRLRGAARAPFSAGGEAG